MGAWLVRGPRLGPALVLLPLPGPFSLTSGVAIGSTPWAPPLLSPQTGLCFSFLEFSLFALCLPAGMRVPSVKVALFHFRKVRTTHPTAMDASGASCGSDRPGLWLPPFIFDLYQINLVPLEGSAALPLRALLLNRAKGQLPLVLLAFPPRCGLLALTTLG